MERSIRGTKCCPLPRGPAPRCTRGFIVGSLEPKVSSPAGELRRHAKTNLAAQRRLVKPKSGEYGGRTPDETLTVMRSMAGEWSDEHIAATSIAWPFHGSGEDEGPPSRKLCAQNERDRRVPFSALVLADGDHVVLRVPRQCALVLQRVVDGLGSGAAVDGQPAILLQPVLVLPASA